MAFDRTKLVHVSSYSTLTHIWTLETSDDVTAAGYIPKDQGVGAGDKVIKVEITRSEAGLVTGRTETEYYAADDEQGVLTLTAMSVDESDESDEPVVES